MTGSSEGVEEPFTALSKDMNSSPGLAWDCRAHRHPQLPFKVHQIPSDGGHKALNKGTLGVYAGT